MQKEKSKRIVKNTHGMGVYEKYLKRPFDFILALISIIILSPLLIVIAVLVRVKLGSPVIFLQPRPGLNGRIFNLYKFRTMTDEKDSNGNLLPDDKRLTKFGNMLRHTSLDELPELFCILKGDMSIIGPRPLLVRYLDRYSAEQLHRHDVRPGLSGLAQVNGRNAISWDEKFKYDLEYVRHITFLGDVKIIILTLIKAFIKREGIMASDIDTMPEFMGNEEK